MEGWHDWYPIGFSSFGLCILLSPDSTGPSSVSMVPAQSLWLLPEFGAPGTILTIISQEWKMHPHLQRKKQL